jgi:hypothetical protein
VDAVKRALLILLRMLFHRPLIFVMLLLVYSLGLLLVHISDAPNRGLGLLVLCAFAAGGLAAVLSERIGRFSVMAGAIGLPDHTRVMRQVQRLFLLVFVAIPLITTISLGTPWLPGAATMVAATGLGALLGGSSAFWVILLPLAGRVPAIQTAITLPAVQVLIVLGGAWVVWRWFWLPERAAQAGGFMPAMLADAVHERVMEVEGASAPPGMGQPLRPATAVHAALESGRQLSQVLAGALGYSVHLAWRAVWIGIGLAVTVLGAWHFFHGRQPRGLAYAFVTGLCCLTIATRAQTVLRRWTSTSGEQSALCLAPGWPSPTRIKRAMLETLFSVQRGSVVVWAVSASLMMLLEDESGAWQLAGALAIFGTSLTVTGVTCAVLARRQIRAWHLSTLILFLVTVAGGLLALFGDSIRAVACGLAMMVAPNLFAVVSYLRAPLRVPVDVDPQVLQRVL